MVTLGDEGDRQLWKDILGTPELKAFVVVNLINHPNKSLKQAKLNSMKDYQDGLGSVTKDCIMKRVYLCFTALSLVCVISQPAYAKTYSVPPGIAEIDPQPRPCPSTIKTSMPLGAQKTFRGCKYQAVTCNCNGAPEVVGGMSGSYQVGNLVATTRVKNQCNQFCKDVLTKYQSIAGCPNTTVTTVSLAIEEKVYAATSVSALFTLISDAEAQTATLEDPTICVQDDTVTWDTVPSISTPTFNTDILR